MHFDVFVDEVVEVVVNEVLGWDNDSLGTPLDSAISFLKNSTHGANSNVVAIDTEVLNGPGNACILSNWNRDPLCDSGIAEPTDRKSTRLNSSHGYISYAVFCLKKKN